MWNSVDVAGLGSNASGREVSCGCRLCVSVCKLGERKGGGGHDGKLGTERGRFGF